MAVASGADNANVTRVTSSASSVSLSTVGRGRRSLQIYNESTAVLYVKYGGTGASVTDYTIQIPPSAAGSVANYFSAPQPVFRGPVWGIWAAANGAAQVTEGY